MGYRNLVIASDVHLYNRNGQLEISGLGVHKVPLEDVKSIVLENLSSQVTVSTLQRLVDCGAAVYICDDKHLPSAVILPFFQHSRNCSVIKEQEALSLPTIKNAWKQIVMAKIENQSQCLLQLEKEKEGNHLEQLAKTVASGDPKNVEATAARYYFRYLFDENFTRGDEEDCRNHALNYGYAIMRGMMARLLAGYGFLLFRGLHHANFYNAFNLADDFMEPMRPLVDLYVTKTFSKDTVLTTSQKAELLGLLDVDVLSGEQHHSASYGMERMVQSFNRICQKKGKALVIPKFIGLHQHCYE
jgi:CRISPR-associated protein Cas1